MEAAKGGERERVANSEFPPCDCTKQEQELKEEITNNISKLDFYTSILHVDLK